jgi:hypothetical protein
MFHQHSYITKITISLISGFIWISANLPLEAQGTPGVKKIQNDTKTGGISPREKATPPVDDAPIDTTPGGRRNEEDCIPKKKPFLTPLIPQSDRINLTYNQIKTSVPFGKTSRSQPTLFFYIPPTNAAEAQFILHDQNQVISQKTFPLNPQTSGGVIGLKFNPNKGLENEKYYQWELLLICQPKDRAKDIIVRGVIQKVDLKPEIKAKLEKAQGRDRVLIYASAGIWHDTLATLAETRRTNPNDATLVNDWIDLLKEVKLGEFANEPLLDFGETQ